MNQSSKTVAQQLRERFPRTQAEIEGRGVEGPAKRDRDLIHKAADLLEGLPVETPARPRHIAIGIVRNGAVEWIVKFPDDVLPEGLQLWVPVDDDSIQPVETIENIVRDPDWRESQEKALCEHGHNPDACQDCH